ncbi:HK97-gp10 family putative phage morphogenesis protein [Thioclava sp. DLFJ4-1]|uniref:HK97-gp10 family putative phage morphogenesis protein n=1 Tax=Thioclava sp. DLFJ4-1 TaxID=1915313 RepID=UPI00099638B3|nr:HK97-gp10 family putative phage morphogenesis protein [Thioclava sp. DLFJ4-1]OOY16719.1 hypothetical protein BMI85_06540 [Thioclava sp. DLFJ4-1]
MPDYGANRLIAKLRKHGAAVIKAADAAAKQGADETANVMRATAPRDDLELVRSIRVEKADQVMSSKGKSSKFIGYLVKAGDETTIVTNERGVKFQNAKLQEHGTKNMPANPYFNPSWRRVKSRVKARITRQIRKAWQSGNA